MADIELAPAITPLADNEDVAERAATPLTVTACGGNTGNGIGYALRIESTGHDVTRVAPVGKVEGNAPAD